MPSQIVRHCVENACPFPKDYRCRRATFVPALQGTYLPQLLILILLMPGFIPGPHPNVQQLAPRTGIAGNFNRSRECLQGVKKKRREPISVTESDVGWCPDAEPFFVRVWASQARGPEAITRSRKDRDPGIRREVRLTHTPRTAKRFIRSQSILPLRSVRIRSWTKLVVIRCGGSALIAREGRAGLLKIHPLGVSPCLAHLQQTATSCSCTTVLLGTYTVRQLHDRRLNSGCCHRLSRRSPYNGHM